MLFSGMEKKFLTTKNGKLVYYEGGNGPTILLVHGYIADAGNWYKVVPDLIKNFHLIIPDLPGHGESDPVGDKLLPEDLLDGLVALINEKSASQKIILVGNSMGGWVSMMATLALPEKISILILENSAGLKMELPQRILIPQDIASAKELYDVLLGKDAPSAPDFVYKNLIGYMNQNRFKYLLTSLQDKYFMDNKLQSITIPVYLIWGGSDRLFPPDYSNRLKKEFRNAQLITEISAGHALHFTNPKKFDEIFLSICKNNASCQN